VQSVSFVGIFLRTTTVKRIAGSPPSITNMFTRAAVRERLLVAGRKEVFSSVQFNWRENVVMDVVEEESSEECKPIRKESCPAEIMRKKKRSGEETRGRWCH